MSIEEAFDIKHVCCLYDPINQQFTFRVLNHDLLTKPIYTTDHYIFPTESFPTSAFWGSTLAALSSLPEGRSG